MHEGQLAQIRNTVRASHILVEQRLDGTMRLTHHGRALDWHTITARPGSVAEAQPLPRAHCPVRPKPNHPWRNRWWQERAQHTAAAGTEPPTFLLWEKEDISNVG